MKLPFISPESRYGEEFAGYAAFFRNIALEIDCNPDAIFNYVNHPAIQLMINDKHSDTYTRTTQLEAYAYGDPGVILASPGPSLSGLMMRELGTPSQIDDFYEFLRLNHARTFFALTEPSVGSDAGALKCQLTPIANSNNFYLNGEKCLFGNGAAGKTGIILARTNSGPLGIRAVLITPKMLQQSNWITRESLPMTGLRGAQISYMKFDQCIVSSEQLLGSHLKPMQYGMMAVIKTFNRLRTGVGAFAIGQAQAILDYVHQHKRHWNKTEEDNYCYFYYKIDSIRELLINAAKKIDSNPFDSHTVSIAKIESARVAEETIKFCIDILEPYALLENAWLAKAYRDSFAWEFMEGTQNMLLKDVYQTRPDSQKIHT